MSDEMQCNHIECEIRGCDCGCHVPDFTPRCQIAAHQGSLADDPQAVERGAKAFWTEDAFTEAGWENENPGVRQWYINQAETVLRAAEND